MATCILDLIRDHGLDFVGIQETMKKDFSSKFLRKIDPGECFEWRWTPSVGKSGGILCGTKKDTFDVKNCEVGKYIMKMEVWDKSKKLNYCVLVVYGSAHEEFKEEFLVELAAMCSNMSVPYIVGGDLTAISSLALRDE